MPLPVISVSQMREWELATWKSGQTEAEVIRQVGEQIARKALALTAPDGLILILAGKGHNGDDARAARERLNERRVNLLDCIDPAAILAKLDALLSLEPDLIIDGLFGIGLNRPLDSAWRALVEKINAARRPVLAVDIPSGLNGDSGEPQGAALQATLTLTVGAPKVGLLQAAAMAFVGRLEVASDVGLVSCPVTSPVQWTLPADFKRFPSPRQEATHKGTYGHLSIVAGSVGYHGAAVLAARAAQRAKPGLVTLLTTEGAYQPVASQLQAVMVSPRLWPVSLPERSDTLLAGPGLAGSDVPEPLKAWLQDQWATSPHNVVLDASALDWLKPGPAPVGRETPAVRVITPHPGEAARLLGITTGQVQADRLSALHLLSSRFGNAWVVLKGHQTLVGRADGGKVFINCSGNPYLAQGGSGDVLSGFIAGLLAQPSLRNDPARTLRYAVWQHGAAADQLQRTRRNWTVEDLVLELGNCD